MRGLKQNENPWTSTIREGPEAARRHAERRLLDNIPFFEETL